MTDLSELEKLARALLDRAAEPDGWCEADLLLPAAEALLEAAREIDALRADRDLVEQTIIDASNGMFAAAQGQADSEDSTDGLAHWVYARREARQLLTPRSETEEG